MKIERDWNHDACTELLAEEVVEALEKAGLNVRTDDGQIRLRAEGRAFELVLDEVL